MQTLGAGCGWGGGLLSIVKHFLQLLTMAVAVRQALGDVRRPQPFIARAFLGDKIIALSDCFDDLFSGCLAHRFFPDLGCCIVCVVS